MNANTSPFRFFVMMLCLLMLVLRLGGAHIHLCFDGGEAPSTIHYDAYDADHEHEQSGHHDLNIDLGDSALVKKASNGMDLLALLSVALFLLALPHDSVIKLKPQRDLAPLLRDFFHLRPPLRGPPRLSLRN